MTLLLRGSMVPPPPSYKFEEFKENTYNETIITKSEWKTYSGSANSAIGKTPTYYWDYLETNYPSSDYVVLFNIDTRESVETIAYSGGIATDNTLNNIVYCYDTTLPSFTRIQYTIIKRNNPLLKYKTFKLTVRPSQWNVGGAYMFDINNSYPIENYLIYYEPMPTSQEERNYFINSCRLYPQAHVNVVSFEADQPPTMDLHFFVYAIDKKSKSKELSNVEQGIYKINAIASDKKPGSDYYYMMVGPRDFTQGGSKEDYIVFYEPIAVTEEQKQVMHKMNFVRDSHDPNLLSSTADLTEEEKEQAFSDLSFLPIAYTAIPAKRITT